MKKVFPCDRHLSLFDGNSLSLFKGRKVNLARSRFHNSQTNRNAVDRSSPHSGQNGLGLSAAKNQKPQNFSRHIDLITSSRAMIKRFPTRLAKAGTKTWASRVCGTGSVASSAIS
jgi:hypothetical protein